MQDISTSTSPAAMIGQQTALPVTLSQMSVNFFEVNISNEHIFVKLESIFLNKND